MEDRQTNQINHSVMWYKQVYYQVYTISTTPKATVLWNRKYYISDADIGDNRRHL
jgi:uncharacterized protein (DUF608 family)